MEKLIRKLARSNYWQILYSRSLEIGSLRLFKNEGEYSNLQIEFLFWLQTYNYLYSKLREEDELLIEEYFDCDISIDAYLYYRRKHKAEDTPKTEITGGSSSFKLVQKKKE